MHKESYVHMSENFRFCLLLSIIAGSVNMIAFYAASCLIRHLSAFCQ